MRLSESVDDMPNRNRLKFDKNYFTIPRCRFRVKCYIILNTSPLQWLSIYLRSFDNGPINRDKRWTDFHKLHYPLYGTSPRCTSSKSLVCAFWPSYWWVRMGFTLLKFEFLEPYWWISFQDAFHASCSLDEFEPLTRIVEPKRKFHKTSWN